MGGQAELKGPDLGAGVDASQLEPGDKLLGHANGESVLLARVGDDYLAIGATCTHYGGPLAEGVIDGETVRCPWHHACFSLRTGEALRAPALSPVACWNVERRGGKVVVTNKAERDPLAPTYPLESDRARHPRTTVIVGAGAAGSAAAEMLRRCGYDGRISMIDDDASAPYDRPNLSKDYLAGNAPEEWIPLRPDGFYAERKIDIIRARARRIDLRARTVEVDGREPLQFDALILAPGADPVHLPLPGADLPHVHYLRTLADSRALVAAAKSAKRAVVIGSSFIGLEVAASLRARQIEVDVVSPDTVPLGRVLGDYLGGFIKSFHESHGVRFHLGRKPQGIEAGAVVLDDGTRLAADLVAIGVGVRPRLDLAEQAGLATDKGVSVNEYLETSVPGIYAAGDIARWPDAHSGQRIRVEHWIVAQRQGQVAARNVLGARERFEYAPFFWSAHYDVSINYVGHAEQWDDVKIDGDAAKHDVSVRLMRGGDTAALATIFRDEESLREELREERSGKRDGGSATTSLTNSRQEKILSLGDSSLSSSPTPLSPLPASPFPLPATLSRREREIMDVVYRRGHATAAEIHDQLSDPPCAAAVRTQLRILEDKGHLRHEKDGPRHIYFPTVARSVAQRSAVKHLLGTFFNGSRAAAVAALLEESDRPLSTEERKEITSVIRRLRAEDR